MDTNQEPVNATMFFCRESFELGEGPINQLQTKKLLERSFTNETKHEHVAHIFTEDNDREIGLYRLDSGEFWLFEDVGLGRQKPAFELSFVGNSMEEVVALLG